MINPVRRVSFWLLLAIFASELVFTSHPRAFGFGEVGSLGVYDNAGFAPAAVVDSARGFAYFSSNNLTATYTEIRLSNFSVASRLYVYGATCAPSTAVIDEAGGFAYLTSSDGCIVKLRLSDFTATRYNLPYTGDSPASSVIDTLHGFIYIGTVGSTSRIFRIRLSNFTLDSYLNVNFDHGLASALIDPLNGFAYFGTTTGGTTATNAGHIVRIRLSDFTVAGNITLNQEEFSYAQAGVIDVGAGFAYFGMGYESTISVVKIRLSSFTRVASLKLSKPLAGAGPITAAVIEPALGYAYFVRFSTEIVQVRLSDFTQTGSQRLNEVYPNVATADTSLGFAYVGGGGLDTGVVGKIQLAGEGAPPNGSDWFFIGGGVALLLVIALVAIRRLRRRRPVANPLAVTHSLQHAFRA